MIVGWDSFVRVCVCMLKTEKIWSRKSSFAPALSRGHISFTSIGFPLCTYLHKYNPKSILQGIRKYGNPFFSMLTGCHKKQFKIFLCFQKRSLGVPHFPKALFDKWHFVSGERKLDQSCHSIHFHAGNLRHLWLLSGWQFSDSRTKLCSKTMFFLLKPNFH